MKLSNSELDALHLVQRSGGSLLVSAIPDRNEQGVFGVEPGMTIYIKLAKKGLVFFTEEEPIVLNGGELFEFTPSVYLTDEGTQALK